MLELRNIDYTLTRRGEDLPLLSNVSIRVESGHFMAIVGPSGCGKTTLLKVVAGLQLETGGEIHWRGENLGEDGVMEPQELGYVPQFSIAHEHLTVEECVENAARLRTRESGGDLYSITDRVIAEVGMESMRERRVAVLSGGQKRRLGLAMELVSRPHLLLCDEVTSGLDPQSEREIVELLHSLSEHGDRIVVNVTHSLSNLDLYDSVLVMHEGRVVYHGPPDAMLHYFSVEKAEAIYPGLAVRTAEGWHESWGKYREAYYGKLEKKLAARAPVPAAEQTASHAPAGFLRQTAVLLARRWRLFLRDRTQLILQLALLLGFPVLVVLFASDGLPPMPDRSVPDGVNPLEAAQHVSRAVERQVEIGGLISGLVMFQVILLALMGSNNSAREISGERLTYEKERLGGLGPGAYLLSKILFLTVLAGVQSVWMGVFVNHFTGLPGALGDRIALLFLLNAAMTSVCLGISANLKSPDQSSLLSIYFVGFQLPLSGAVLALPGVVERLVQPLIASYWSWSGQLSAMRESPLFISIDPAVPTGIISQSSTAVAVLAGHVVCGLTAAWIGCRRHRWD